MQQQLNESSSRSQQQQHMIIKPPMLPPKGNNVQQPPYIAPPLYENLQDVSTFSINGKREPVFEKKSSLYQQIRFQEDLRMTVNLSTSFRKRPISKSIYAKSQIKRPRIASLLIAIKQNCATTYCECAVCIICFACKFVKVGNDEIFMDQKRRNSPLYSRFWLFADLKTNNEGKLLFLAYVRLKIPVLVFEVLDL